MKIKPSQKARIVSLILFCALILPHLTLFVNSSGELSQSRLSAKSAILVDADSGAVLFEKDARRRMGEASTTKIMTALVAAETLPLEHTVKIPPEAVGVEGSSVYLREGEILSIGDLLHALLLASANDAAVALAIACAGSVEDFAQKMNERAYSLGLSDTNFTNPHGLYDEQHYTTAYDLAQISAAALNNEELAEIFAKRKTEIPLGVTKDAPEGEGVRYLQNHNKMLVLYNGAIGIKTGFTKKSGRCLVSAARRDGLTLIAVTLNAPSDWSDHSALLDYGFEHYRRVTLYDVGEFTYQYAVSGGREQYVCATNSAPISLTVAISDVSAPASKLVCFPQRFEVAPISEGTYLGSLTVRVGNAECSSPLVAAYTVARAEKQRKFFPKS